MGRVFSARHVALGRKVAIKVLKSEFLVRRAFVERFFQEPRRSTRFNHEHIIEIMTSSTSRRRQGTTDGSLRDGAAHRREPGRHLAKVSADRSPAGESRQTDLLALQAAHQTSVIHRDVNRTTSSSRDAAGGHFAKMLDSAWPNSRSSRASSSRVRRRKGRCSERPATCLRAGARARRRRPHRHLPMGVVLYRSLTGHPHFADQQLPRVGDPAAAQCCPAAGQDIGSRASRFRSSCRTWSCAALKKSPAGAPSDGGFEQAAAGRSKETRVGIRQAQRSLFGWWASGWGRWPTVLALAGSLSTRAAESSGAPPPTWR